MSLEVHKEGEEVKARLFGALGVQMVADLHRTFAEVCAPDSAVELDAGGVERLDTSIAQLFTYWALRVRRFEVVQASEAWEDAVRTLGLPLLLPRESASRRDDGNENNPVGR